MISWDFYWREALSNLGLSKLRTGLAILGVLVGTCAVVSLVTIGEMAKYKALAEFKNLGMDLASLSINQNIDFKQGIDWTHTFIPNYAFAQNIQHISEASPFIKKVAPVSSLSTMSYFKGHRLDTEIIASTEAFPDIAKMEVTEGRFFSRFDQANYYCVVGDRIANQMRTFGSSNVIGKELQLGDTFFTVIGVAKPWLGNELMMTNVDTSILITLSAAHHIVPSLYIDNTLLQLQPNTDPDTLEAQVHAYFSKQYPQVSIEVHTGKQLIQSMTHQKNIFTWTLGLIGCIALFVSGIGIMNVMLVSVAERKREIGIRLAIGAKQKDITMMFLCEAILLSVSGGIAGIVVAFAVTLLVANFLQWPFVFSAIATVSGLLVSVLTGIFFGYYPAHKAAHLNPIDVLRAE